jgi:hypothetical protein
MVSSNLGVYDSVAYRDKKVVGVFVRFSLLHQLEYQTVVDTS